MRVPLYDRSNQLILQEETEIGVNFNSQRGVETKVFYLIVEMTNSRLERGSLLTEALCQILMENKSPEPLNDIMHYVSIRLNQLQGSRKDYYCEQRIIGFPLDFYMNPIKQDNFLPMYATSLQE